MPKLPFIFALLLFFSACSTEKSTSNTEETVAKDTTETKPQAAPEDNFQTAFSTYFEALQNSDTAAFNQFIHPKYGLWVIEQPGAVPKMTQVHDIRNFGREYQGKSFFTIALEIKQCNLVEEPFPSFDCADLNYDAGKTGYSKDGCFVWDAEKFKTSGYWNYASLSEAKIQQIIETLPLVQKTVLHTNTSFEFHFGKVDDQWYLLFAKIMYPCSA
ncbi:hypothetical protein [Pontibacter cellulosilyticus]|uniref:Lipoprotein n=1 Tax=Pontibacter cellulosilyticus TaxID=1720253 RepID=A0A923N6C0_9BACT|nr:hypothetical protein [Pontibacter cellulosilyticus]MBC5993720.1 hypothetical protein [Pontibacter cellulosilyticus]